MVGLLSVYLTTGDLAICQVSMVGKFFFFLSFFIIYYARYNNDIYSGDGAPPSIFTTFICRINIDITMIFSRIKLFKVDINLAAGVSFPVKITLQKLFKVHLETCLVQQTFLTTVKPHTGQCTIDAYYRRPGSNPRHHMHRAGSITTSMPMYWATGDSIYKFHLHVNVN